MKFKTINEVKAEIEKWHKAYKDWNNKKLPDEERDKAENYIDNCCEKDTTITEAEARLESLNGVFMLINKWYKKDCPDKTCRICRNCWKEIKAEIQGIKQSEEENI